jgi:hypothetical protein
MTYLNSIPSHDFYLNHIFHSYCFAASAYPSFTTMDENDLRRALTSAMANSGALDQAKSVLRSKMLAKLRTERAVPSAQRRILPTQLQAQVNGVNALIISHMRALSYEYSSSVFVPEAGTALEQVDDGANLHGCNQ